MKKYIQQCEFCGEFFEDETPPNVKNHVLCMYCDFYRSMSDYDERNENEKKTLAIFFHPEDWPIKEPRQELLEHANQ